MLGKNNANTYIKCKAELSMAYEKEFARIAEVEYPVRRRSLFIGVLSREMPARDAKAPS
jgi:hypothetical protein